MRNGALPDVRIEWRDRQIGERVAKGEWREPCAPPELADEEEVPDDGARVE